ncbi:hypothetical protein OG765_24115 [Streptomyces sp. NBC_00555]|uniref:hypothetical protein n=1 Tax=Streptomyces sp. NBC_00555 TaxID=2903662 RepID=UPI0022596BFF|nr:hypothetical protein [Streptomyces sp. NBC_00555]MCX5014048.1 hypothetical protein [Streptomyces sp. NBC_00555]
MRSRASSCAGGSPPATAGRCPHQRRLWHTALPFSLSAPVRGNTLRITVKRLGGHSRRIRRLRPGTRVLATGPFGALTAARRTRPKVLLIAGGVGITPMRALFETLPGGPGDITLLYRAGAEEQLVLRAELEAIAAERQAGLLRAGVPAGRIHSECFGF